MKILGWLIVNVAWLIPGPSHRWARVVKAERAAWRAYQPLFEQGAREADRRRKERGF